MHIRSLITVCLLVFFFVIPPKAFASAWYYPMDKYDARQTVKGFGQLIDDNFYKGKENLFPFNRFYGYHAAVDLEIFTEEKEVDVPVYSIHSGTITYVGELSGYGGVLLLNLDDSGETALYGHIRVSDSVKKGTKINGEKPQIIAYLGKEFSSETSRERKHLHFGIYKGKDLYFHGHEKSLGVISSKWLDPNEFLNEKQAVTPVHIITNSPTSAITPIALDKDRGFFYNVWRWVISLFRNE